MADLLAYILVVLFILSACGVIDVTFLVEPHVAGQKTICLRGKEVKDGQ
ncbi:MAG: hypothetical protein Q7U97_14195 [Rhodocyclaceae bacterium]|nr:hypothetical protein [Rhodocyclaceae bacterium]